MSTPSGFFRGCRALFHASKSAASGASKPAVATYKKNLTTSTATGSSKAKKKPPPSPTAGILKSTPVSPALQSLVGASEISRADDQMLFRILESCKLFPNLGTAVAVHNKIIKNGYEMYTSLLSLLVSVYVSCEQINLAHQLLDEICFSDFDVIVANMVINSFMKIGEIDIAKKVFSAIPSQDVITWNSTIGGYVKNRFFKDAIDTFKEMLRKNIEPDGFTFASVVTACARLGALNHAKWVHGLMIERRIKVNYILSSALVDMYSRCGRIEIAKDIFSTSKRTDVSVWNAMINGLALHGLALDAILVFSVMKVENVSPDSVTFIGILTACSHCGFVDQGRKYFNLMQREHSIQPQLEHYGTMVDLLARAGLLEEAYAMIKEMPLEPDVVIWRALLSACRTHKNPELGEVAITRIKHLGSGDFVLLSNIYSSMKKWDRAETVRYTMKKNGVRKCSGKSLVELGGVIHQFRVADRYHPETEAIYELLDALIHRTRMQGYVSVSDLVFMDISEEEKEENLNYHSEKLALTYAILKSSPGIEIQISKNLRTCLDCHSWIKIVSQVLNRVIIVRDRIRFHRFESGSCTCGDYW